MRAATLTDHLAGWPDDRLERLFALRPDLCHPPVPDFAALAAVSAAFDPEMAAVVRGFVQNEPGDGPFAELATRLISLAR